MHRPLLIAATGAVALVPTAAQAATVTPSCAAPGAKVAYAASLTSLSTIPASVRLTWFPQLVDPANGAVFDGRSGDEVVQGDVPVAPDGSASATVATPAAKRMRGMVVDSWKVQANTVNADGTSFGTGAAGDAVVDVAGTSIQVARASQRGGQLPITAKGFGDRTVYAKLVYKGKAVRTITLRPPAENSACGSAEGDLSARSALTLQRGKYTVTVSTTKGGKPAVSTPFKIV